MNFTTWYQWKLLRLRRWWDNWRREAGNFWRGAEYGYVMCPECRALIDRGARQCDRCGARQPRRIGGRSARILAIFGISELSPNQLLVVGFLIAYITSTLLAGAGGSPASLVFGPDGKTLIRLGSAYSPLVVYGQWWRWITYLYLHGGLLHLFFNSYALMVVGPQIEAFFGRNRFYPLFLACGVVSGAASTLLRAANVVGASGALFGLIGAMIAYGWRRGGAFGQMLRQSFTTWAIYGILFGLVVPNVDNVAHVVGLLAGMAIGLLAAEVRPAGPAVDRLWGIASATALALTMLAVLLAARFFWTTS